MWAALIPALGALLDKIIPDANQAAETKLKLIELAQKQDTDVLNAIVKISEATAATNTAEASSEDPYTSRWRPTIGYVLGATLAYSYIFGPILQGIAAIWFPEAKVPDLHLDENLWELMIGMLGLAGWRTLDKIKGK
jgi:hypothetical protein